MEERYNDITTLLERIHRMETSIAEIHMQLSRIISDIDNRKGARARVNADFIASIRELKYSLYGNGTVGIVTRLDRLEQVQSGRRRAFGYIWAAIISLAGAFLTFILKDNHG